MEMEIISFGCLFLILLRKRVNRLSDFQCDVLIAMESGITNIIPLRLMNDS